MYRTNGEKRSRAAAVPALLAVTAAFAVGGTITVGCGSGNRTVTVPGAATFAEGSTYTTTTVALGTGRSGTLSVLLGANGLATGTLDLFDPTRAASSPHSRLITIATPHLQGTYDPSTGAIHLTGSYTVNGQVYNVTVTGTLPHPPSYTGGSVTLTINDQSYTYAFGVPATPSPTPTPTPSATPTPTPTPSATPSPTPTPTPTPTPVPTPTPTPTPAPGSARIDFSNVSADVNGMTTDYVAAYVFTGINAANGKGHLEVLIQPTKADSSRLIYIGIDDASGPIVAGNTYAPTGGNQLNYEERTPNGLVHKWSATAGKVIIKSIDGTTIHVQVSNATLSPNAANGGATGTFTLNFDATTTEAGGAGGG